MRITNKYGLSEGFVAAVTNDTYDKGAADISVTELWSPPQQRALIAKHWDDLEEDAIDRVWSLWGSAMHYVLQRAGESVVGHIIEKRISTDFEGWNISGQPDATAIKTGVMTDYKNVSVWSVLKGSKDTEWSYQLSTYAWLLRRQAEPIEVKALSVEAILRDWSKLEARRNRDYPEHNVYKTGVPLIDDARMTELIRERLKEHATSPPRECTTEEVWAKPTAFAVMKGGRQRAIGKLHLSEADAIAWIDRYGKPGEGLFIEAREAKRIRCASYCAAAPFCAQYQQWLQNSSDGVVPEPSPTESLL